MGKKKFDLIQILCIQIFGLSERLVLTQGHVKTFCQHFVPTEAILASQSPSLLQW